MLVTTLNEIRDVMLNRRETGQEWRHLLHELGKKQADGDPLPFSKLLEICGLDDALACCWCVPRYSRKWRLFAIWCVRHIQHLSSDDRCTDALDVAERYANGRANIDELLAVEQSSKEAVIDARLLAQVAEVADREGIENDPAILESYRLDLWAFAAEQVAIAAHVTTWPENVELSRIASQVLFAAGNEARLAALAGRAGWPRGPLYAAQTAFHRRQAEMLKMIADEFRRIVDQN